MDNCDGGVGERPCHSFWSCAISTPPQLTWHRWVGPQNTSPLFAWLWWVWDSRDGSAMGLPSQPLLQPLHCREYGASNSAWSIYLLSPSGVPPTTEQDITQKQNLPPGRVSWSSFSHRRDMAVLCSVSGEVIRSFFSFSQRIHWPWNHGLHADGLLCPFLPSAHREY